MVSPSDRYSPVSYMVSQEEPEDLTDLLSYASEQLQNAGWVEGGLPGAVAALGDPEMLEQVVSTLVPALVPADVRVCQALAASGALEELARMLQSGTSSKDVKTFAATFASLAPCPGAILKHAFATQTDNAAQCVTLLASLLGSKRHQAIHPQVLATLADAASNPNLTPSLAGSGLLKYLDSLWAKKTAVPQVGLVALFVVGRFLNATVSFWSYRSI